MQSINRVPAGVLALLALLLITLTVPPVAAQNTLAVPADYPTINAALDAAESGDIIEIASGVYREQISRVDLESISLVGTNTIVSAFEIVSGWQPDENDSGAYYASWTYDIGPSSNPWPNSVDLTCQSEVAMTVWVDGVRYDPACALDELAAGTFYEDREANRLYVLPEDGIDITTAYVEASARRYGLRLRSASGVSVSGITFEGCASGINDGCVRIQESSDVALSNVSALRGSYGGVQITDSQDILVFNLTAQDNGARGFGVYNVNRLFVDSGLWERQGWRVELAEYGGPAPLIAWDGGQKILLCNECTLQNIVIRQTHGIGLWLDFDNRDLLLSNFTIEGSVLAGLFVEATCSPTIQVENGVVRTTSVRNDNEHYFNADLFQTGSNGVLYRDILVESSTHNAVLLTNPERDVDSCQPTNQHNTVFTGLQIVRVTEGNAFNLANDSTGYIATTRIEASVRGPATYLLDYSARSLDDFVAGLADGSSIEELPE